MSILRTTSFPTNVIISDAIGTPAAPGAYFGFANALGTVVASTGPRFQTVNANPNGTLTSPIGSLCIDSVTGILYQNTNGLMAWSAIVAGSSGGSYVVEANAVSRALNATTDVGKVLTNEGAGGLVTFTLPAAVAGLNYKAVVADADGIAFVAGAGDTIELVAAGGGFTTLTSTWMASTLELIAINATRWVGFTSQANWTMS